jgi:hypothetical protein
MRIALLSLFLLVGAICSPLQAQSEPLADNQRAVMAFDVRLDMLRGSELAKTLNLEDQIKAMTQQNDGIDPSKLKRVFGALSAPESMEAAQGFMMGQVPIEFFMKFEFSDSATVTEMIAKAESKGATSFEKNGKTYYNPPADGETPEGLIMHQVDATTMQMGTEAYIFHPQQKELFSDGLKDSWDKVPDETIRIALDLEGASGIVNEVVAMGKQNGDAMTGAYLDLVDNLKDLRLSLDFSGANMLTLRATGVGESEAEEVRGGLDSILGIAKMAGGAQAAALKQQNEAAGEAIEEILKSLEAKNEGVEISVVIPKPAGFEAAVKSAVEMFGGGLGGPQSDIEIDGESAVPAGDSTPGSDGGN